jgi:hypothetical protein
MSNTTIFRNEEKLTKEQVTEKFKSVIENNKNFSDSIEGLAELFAKNPTDNFIVYDSNLDAEAAQGDILIYGKNTGMYKTLTQKLNNVKKATNMNLQEGESVTGDHKIIPLKGSELTIEDCTVYPEILNGKPYAAKRIVSDKPFLIYHGEHGNQGLPAGTYLSCVALDPSTLRRVLD